VYVGEITGLAKYIEIKISANKNMLQFFKLRIISKLVGVKKGENEFF